MKLIEIEKRFLQGSETSLFGKFKNILFGAVFYLFWSSIVLFLYKKFIPEFNLITLQFFHPSQIYTFISSCILAPVVEEIIFRFFPLELAKILKVEGLTIIFIILSSVIFGLIHTGGKFAVPVQGIAGLLFCYVYIKNGYSLISSILMHFIINFYCFLT